MVKRYGLNFKNTGHQREDNFLGEDSVINYGSEENNEADIMRVAQWEEDEDELDFQKELDVNSEKDEISELNNLKNIPLGSLHQAQSFLTHAQTDTESDDESYPESESQSTANANDRPTEKLKIKDRVEWNSKPRNNISKRSSKHAPMEVTSKKPVTRRRTIVESAKNVPRDPRFLPTAGEFSTEKFHKQYNFLAENHRSELETLRGSLKQARKILATSPRHLRDEREHEVLRLEQAVKRAESTVNKDRLEKVSREALGKIKKDEQQKRKQGKKEWWMKKGEEEKILIQARYEALEKEGGQRAITKAIAKKQKKEGQKEKRLRPYAKGEGTPSRKRELEGEVDSGLPSSKRRKVR